MQVNVLSKFRDQQNLSIFILIFASLVGSSLGLLLTISHYTTIFFILVFLVLLCGIILCLINIKAFLLFLLLVRSSLDIFAEKKILFAGFFETNIGGLLMLTMLIAGLFYILINRNKITLPSLSSLYLIFLMLGIISIFISPVKIESFKEWIIIVSLFALYVLVVNIFKTKTDMSVLITTIFLSAPFPLALGFYQFFTNSGNLQTPGFNRIFGTFAHPNGYAFYLTILSVMSFVLTLQPGSSLRRLSLGGLCILASLSVFLTFTRAAWMGLIVAFLIVGGIKHRQLLIIVPLILIILLSLVPTTSARLTDTSESSSWGWRIKFWKQTYSAFANQLIVGNGVGSFPHLVYKKEGKALYPHNDYLKFVVEMGVPGLLVYLSIIFGLMKNSFCAYLRSSNSYNKSLYLGFISFVAAYLVMGISDNIFRYTGIQWYFWSFAAVVAGLANSEKDNL